MPFTIMPVNTAGVVLSNTANGNSGDSYGLRVVQNGTNSDLYDIFLHNVSLTHFLSQSLYFQLAITWPTLTSGSVWNYQIANSVVPGGTGYNNTSSPGSGVLFPGYNPGTGIIAPLKIATIAGSSGGAGSYTFTFTLQSSTTLNGTYTTVANQSTSTTVYTIELPDAGHITAPFNNHNLSIVWSASATGAFITTQSGASSDGSTLLTSGSITIDGAAISITGTAALASINSLVIDYQLTLPADSSLDGVDIENAATGIAVPQISAVNLATGALNGMTYQVLNGTTVRAITNLTWSRVTIKGYDGVYGASSTAFSGTGTSNVINNPTFLTTTATNANSNSSGFVILEFAEGVTGQAVTFNDLNIATN